MSLISKAVKATAAAAAPAAPTSKKSAAQKPGQAIRRSISTKSASEQYSGRAHPFGVRNALLIKARLAYRRNRIEDAEKAKAEAALIAPLTKVEQRGLSMAYLDANPQQPRPKKG